MEPYVIIKKLPDGSKVWVGEVWSLQEAKGRLIKLERTHPAEYYVCNLSERRVLGAATPRWPELHVNADDPIFVR